MSHRVMVSPGSMGLVALAVELLGCDAVDPGSWLKPFWLKSDSKEELEAALELLQERCDAYGQSPLHYVWES